VPKEQGITCIMCPLGCFMTVTIDDTGEVSGVVNNLCKEGEKYAISECKFPGRTLTTTVLTEGSQQKLLPAKSNRPIPKERLMEAMSSLSGIKVKPPIKMGQVIVPNIIGTGVDLIAGDELLN
jgi:CxxC motif-containing protein